MQRYNAEVIARHYSDEDLELLAVASTSIRGICNSVCDRLERKQGTIFKFFKDLEEDQAELDAIVWELLFPGVDFK